MTFYNACVNVCIENGLEKSEAIKLVDITTQVVKDSKTWWGVMYTAIKLTIIVGKHKNKAKFRKAVIQALHILTSPDFDNTFTVMSTTK